MIPWETVDVPLAERSAAGDHGLSLHRRGDEWSIRWPGGELMNSTRVESERALARLAADAMRADAARRVLVGGLGMGHTLAAALAAFPRAHVVVAELSPRVVAWNRGPLGAVAGRPLDDARAEVAPGDVGARVRAAAAGAEARYDAILIDVDNGPEALYRAANGALYSKPGIAAARDALAPGGVLGVWSAGPDAAYEKRLSRAGFALATHRPPAHAGGGRARFRVWIARRD